MNDSRESDDSEHEVVISKSTRQKQKALPCPEQAIELSNKVKSINVTDDSDTSYVEEYTATPPPAPFNKSIKSDRPDSPKPTTQTMNFRRPTEKINVLLLGESGVGKSTFINSFANYMKHRNFEAVEQNDLTVLIQARFHIFDKDLKNHLVELGTKDENEYLVDGAAATQDVKTYVFSVKIDEVPYEFRLIDTPGMGDPRGIAQDNKNCDYVLNYLGKLEKIHAICILLKPTNARLDVFLNYCVIQILSRLDKSASDNIAFLFTNTRGQNYTPGETYTSLELLLRKIKDTNNVQIPLSKDNVFCFDNEAFRFLAAVKQGVEFKEGILEANIQSWKYSYNEVYRLLSYIVQLRPHDTKRTVSINHARKMVLQLTQPLAEIVQLVGDNIYELEQHSTQLLMESETLDQLKQKLYMPVVDIRVMELPKPVTVCTAPKCSITYKVANKNKFHYKQRCHNPCYLNNVPAEIVGDPKLLQCAAMHGTQSCGECGCRFNTHMHIYYETETFDTKIVDENVMKNITTKEEATEEKRRLINDILDKKEKLQKEHDYIIRCTALFANFLQQNAITPMNDFVAEYVKYLITREESLGPNCEVTNLDYLRRLLAQYEEEKKALEEALKYDTVSNDSNLNNSPLGIERKIRDLFVLPHFGSRIKQLYDLQQIGGLSEHRQTEHVVNEQYQLTIVEKLKESVSNASRYVLEKIVGTVSHKGRNRKYRECNELYYSDGLSSQDIHPNGGSISYRYDHFRDNGRDNENNIHPNDKKYHKSIQNSQNLKALKYNQDHPVATNTQTLVNCSNNESSINCDSKEDKNARTTANVNKNNKKGNKNNKKGNKQKKKKNS
ncbi:uncharacterized protein [Euwallacea similis]|uniref:uncharacterized protein n=1 Tax=Euwallacea similis TaxID=1736056 RepID=UPI00344D7479